MAANPVSSGRPPYWKTHPGEAHRAIPHPPYPFPPAVPRSVAETMGGCASKPRENNANPPSENPSSAELLGKSAEISTSPAPEEVKAEAAADVAVENGPKKESLSDILAATTEPSEDYVTSGDEPTTESQPTAADIIEEREASHAKQAAEEVPVDAEGTENPRAVEPEAPEQKRVEVSENVKGGSAPEGNVAEAPEEAQDATLPQDTAGARETAPTQKDETENSPAMVEIAPASSASLA